MKIIWTKIWQIKIRFYNIIMQNYNEKLELLLKHQHNICPVCEKQLKDSRYILGTTDNKKIDLYYKIHNTKTNQKKYPKLIDSIINLVVMHHDCHLKSNNNINI